MNYGDLKFARGKPEHDIVIDGYVWGMFVAALQWAGWKSPGTLQYTLGHPWMIMHAYPKEWNMIYYTKDLCKHTTPEELARIEASLTGHNYDEHLKSYRAQWDEGHVVIHSHLRPDWSGSYTDGVCGEPLYVMEDDALDMSKASYAVASYFTTHASLTFPGDSRLGALRTIRSQFQLHIERGVFPGHGCGIFKATQAFQLFAEWAARGEFFID